MEQDYSEEIDRRAERVFEAMRPTVTPEQEAKLREAFALARQAHAPQKRRTGEPYIFHPIAVANIVAEELRLGPAAVMAAFLHDVVEDTPVTIEQIGERFGPDVAFLVGVVTKQKKAHYADTKQVDNYRQMLASLQYDVRALLIKLADRLHNMRTLSSMPPAKQMKIAGETDYFYTPLANRLGLYTIKTELENLSFRFRCPQEYDEIVTLTDRDEQQQRQRLGEFAEKMRRVLAQAGIEVRVDVEYRQPYSLWRKMHRFGDDFNHLKYRHITNIVFPNPPQGVTEKQMALRVYSVLTDHFNEKPGGISNYIDSPKENGYRSFHVKLLADFGRWQEVHISSERMVSDSRLGCVAERTDASLSRWIDHFKTVLREIAAEVEAAPAGDNYMDRVVSLFFNDDIKTFTPQGREVVLPQRATVLDFAYEVSPELGRRAKYARVNGYLTSIKAPLRRGDVVEVFTGLNSRPQPDWLDAVVTYSARRAISDYLASQPAAPYRRCPCCNPIPGEEVIGFRSDAPDASGASAGTVAAADAERTSEPLTLHRRDCPQAIRLASQLGDNIESVDFAPDATLYPVTIAVRAVDRYHLFIDLVEEITNRLNLSMSSFNTETVDSIATITISFAVHSAQELQSVISHIAAIPGVDEVKRVAA